MLWPIINASFDNVYSQLTHEIDYNKVQDNMSEKEIGKSSFWSDCFEILGVLGIDLQSQVNCNKNFKRSDLSVTMQS